MVGVAPNLTLAAQAPPTQAPPAPDRTPFNQLFQVQPPAGKPVDPRAQELLDDARRALRERQTALRLLPPEAPRVVCGMTIIPADPSIDPKMLIEVPSAADYTIRRIPPPICR
jgi:hypothetical protein